MSTGQREAVEWLSLRALAALWETEEELAFKRARQVGLKWFDASTRKDKPKPMFRRVDVDAVMFSQLGGESAPEQKTDDDPTAVEPPAEGPPPYVRPDFDPFGKGKAKR